MRRTEGGEPLLALGVRVGPDGTPKSALFEQDERGADGLREYNILEGDSGQASAVADKEGGFLVEHSLLFRSTVLFC